MDMNIHRECADLVILPGLLCDSRMFSDVIAAFPGSRVIDGFYAGCDRLEGMAQYALDRMPDCASLLGHSMGARVALEVLRRAPERIARLALADTGFHMVQPGERERRYALRDIGRDHGMAALVDAWLPPMLGGQALKNVDLCARLRAMCMDAGIQNFEAQIEALLHRPRVDDLLRGIKCPTFAIVGDEDQWSPPSQHEQAVATIANAQLRVILGAGHMAPAEQSRQFNAVLAEWLAIPTI